MLFPFSFTVDLKIQADSYEEACGAAKDYLEMDFLREFLSIPQINLDEVEVSDYSVTDISNDDYYN